MKISFAILLACVVTNIAFAQRSPTFAKEGRIVTLQHWGRNSATVWAVQADRIVVYRVFDSAEPDQMVAEVPITKQQSEKIRKAASSIPSEVRGRVYMPRRMYDGAMLRILFTSDGLFTNDRIEIQNLWLPWLGSITETVSEALPDGQKIRFREQIEETSRMLNWRADWPIETITIEKYYAVPDQPSQTTQGN